jgi:BirA family biotin operon repressor/biotin-[acetyl-CoA-carboxylase] ligase
VSGDSGDVAASDRPALVASALADALVRDGGLWREIRVVAETGSTNDDVLTAARAGALEGLVLVAESQTAGRGRFERRWVSPPRAGLTFSVLLRPGPVVPASRWSWLPLLAGVSLQRAVARLAQTEALLKWPNDLLLGPGRRKAAGLLVQAAGGAAVLGVGLNVTAAAGELPDAAATSLALENAACTDRERLFRAVLEQFADDYAGWRATGGDAVASGLHSAYLAVCYTIGHRVRVSVPDGAELHGVADTVDDTGRLVLRTPDGRRAVSAGDVQHVRLPGADQDGPVAGGPYRAGP